jgi:hypothetical protein
MSAVSPDTSQKEVFTLFIIMYVFRTCSIAIIIRDLIRYLRQRVSQQSTFDSVLKYTASTRFQKEVL